MRGSHWSVASGVTNSKQFWNARNQSLLEEQQKGGAASSSSIDLEWETAEGGTKSVTSKDIFMSFCAFSDALVPSFAHQVLPPDLTVYDSELYHEEDSLNPEDSMTLSKIPANEDKKPRTEKRPSNASKASSQTSIPGLDWDDQASI